jgi:hypothetical protein
MIYAQYKNDETTKTLAIEFANTEFPEVTPFNSPSIVGGIIVNAQFKPVNATYHLENAINKAFDGKVRPEKVHVKINDPHNYYLKLIAIAFVAYIRGMGYGHPDLTTENF